MASFLDAVGRGGLPLTGAEADRFLAEQVRAAELVGLEDVPTDLTATLVLRGLRTAALRVPERWRHGPIVQQALARAREAS